ncbi:MAG: YigZ family protein [Bacteroidaceae bacterium]|nr:YigZ family protein [Bacteroidaceae bacterium]
MTDTYQTVTSEGTGIYTEKRSKFLAFSFHIDTEEDAKRIITDYQKKYFDARHVCYAYAIGYEGQRTRASDDGEPSGTAGQPILRQIHSFNVTFTLVIVVRYYGGINLGTGPLGVAYKTAAAEALAASTITEKFIETTFTLETPYTEQDRAMRCLKDTEANVSNREYTDHSMIITASVRLSKKPILEQQLFNPNIFTQIKIKWEEES